MYYYKARMYSPMLGRFMQTDPIGYNDGMNWYNYVDGDPINKTDPSGLSCESYTGTARGGCEAAKAMAKAEEARRAAEQCKSDPNCILVQKTAYRPSDVNRYWEEQARAGNPIASLGLQFDSNANRGWLAQASYDGLVRHLDGRGRVYHQNGMALPTGKGLTKAQIARKIIKIRVALMLADKAARAADRLGTPGLLSPKQVADYHEAVFSSFGVSGAFGGGTGQGFVSFFLNPLWCWSCDSN